MYNELYREVIEMNSNILSLARENAPCYVYEYEALRAQAETLHSVFPDFDFLFSVKANPYPPVLKALCSFGIGADAASAQHRPLTGLKWELSREVACSCHALSLLMVPA